MLVTGLFLLPLLSGCTSSLPVSDLTRPPLPASPPIIHVTPLLSAGEFPTLFIDRRLSERNPATQIRVFQLFTQRYASEFPSLDLTFSDTLQQVPHLWRNGRPLALTPLRRLLPLDPDREDWLLAIDTLRLEPIRQNFLKALGRAVFLIDAELPRYVVTLCGRMINLEKENEVTPFRIVQVDRPDAFSSAFDDRLAYTVKDAAVALVAYLRGWRQL